MVKINMIKGMKKKGQVTLFIIIAIVIVGILLSFFLWIGPTYFSEKAKGLEFEGCVEDVVESSIEDLGKNAGFTNPEFTYLYNGESFSYLCYTDEYYKTCILQKVFLDSHFENELEKSIRAGVDNCYVNSVSELGTPTIRLIALQTASTGPVPKAASAKVLPSGAINLTAAVGIPLSPHVT